MIGKSALDERGAVRAGPAAHEPPEERGVARDGVRMLVTRSGQGTLDHAVFSDIGAYLQAGDVLVVNTSATLPAALEVASEELLLHLSTRLPSGLCIVELRRRVTSGHKPFLHAREGASYGLAGGGEVRLLAPHSAGGDAVRLWIARLITPVGLGDYLARYGSPIRYGHVPQPWPLASLQTVFGLEPGSAEMPSAGRPFTTETVTRLIALGVEIVPLLLHTGVSSPEKHEPPVEEYWRVREASARRINSARRADKRIIAVGTTAVRALETAASSDGVVHPGAGYTDLLVTPARGVRVVSGLLTGWHESSSSHLALVTAIAGRCMVRRAYAAALDKNYLWHEFGDVHLALP